jgi:superfamily II DNA or RNA helicase
MQRVASQDNSKLLQHTTLTLVVFYSSSFHAIMDSSMEVDDGAIATVASVDFQLRSYQAEMVEASMKDNIIVVMDTGSGKTHMQVHSIG